MVLGLRVKARKSAGRSSFAARIWQRIFLLWSRLDICRSINKTPKGIYNNRIRSSVFVTFLFPVKAYKAWEEAGAAPTEFKEEDRPVALMQIFKQKSLSGLFTDFTVVWCSLSWDKPCFWKCCFLELHDDTALGSWSDLAKVRQDKETEIPGAFSLQELRPFHRWVKNSW